MSLSTALNVISAGSMNKFDYCGAGGSIFGQQENAKKSLLREMLYGIEEQRMVK